MDENKNPIPSQNSGTGENTPPPTTPAPAPLPGSLNPVVEPSVSSDISQNVPPKTEAPERKEDALSVPPTASPINNNLEKIALEKEDVPQESKKDLNENISASSGGTVSAGTFLKWFFIFGLILVGIFYAVLLWGLLGGSVSNPLFETLGIQSSDLQGLLFMMTNFIFGFLALFFLIGTLVKFFQWLILGKNADNRHEYGVKSTVFFGVFIVVCALWVGLFWVITNADAGTRSLKQSIIATEPQNVIGLTAPITVEFDVTQQLYEQISPEYIRQVSWDFDGDEEIDATGPKVTHRFINKGNNNGRFPVTVKVDYYSPSIKSERIFTTTKEVIISNEAVMAQMKATPVTGAVPLDVTFSAEGSEDPDGQIVLYEWDLNGDGEYEILENTAKTVTKTYAQTGEYMAKLRVTGAGNDTSEAEQKIIVTESEDNLQAKIISDKTFEGLVPFDITLDAEQSYTRFGNIVKYQWQVEGETEVVEGKKLQRTFRTVGEYPVTLIIENDLGERNRVTKIIKALAQMPEATVNIVTMPASGTNGILGGKVPFEVTFDPSASTIHNAVEWRWDFDGNGTVDNYARTAKYTFENPGAYPVKLTIVDAQGNQYTGTQNVVVERAGTQAKITLKPTSGTVPLTVDFDGSASTTDRGEIVDYIWEFPGESPVHSDAQVTYEFSAVGTFSVKLTIVTSEGEQGTTTALVSVRAHPIKANFNILTDDKNPLIFRFDPSSSSGTIVEYLWDFGDGSTSKQFSPIHTYAQEGSYDVSLKVTSSTGIISRITQSVVAGE